MMMLRYFLVLTAVVILIIMIDVHDGTQHSPTSTAAEENAVKRTSCCSLHWA
jgi:hypothetical protein